MSLEFQGMYASLKSLVAFSVFCFLFLEDEAFHKVILFFGVISVHQRTVLNILWCLLMPPFPLYQFNQFLKMENLDISHMTQKTGEV